MKRFIFIVLVFLIIPSRAYAQHVNLGIKGGLNFYTINGDKSSSFESKIGFNIGLLGHIHLSKQIAFQPELVYSTQGTQNKSGSSELRLNLGYVNVPLLLQYMFDNGFRLEAGPQIGILANATSEISNNSINVKPAFRSTDIGLAVGMSYVKPSTGYGFDIRYNLGLTNINISDAVKSYNRGLQLGVFYLFGHRS